MMMIAAFIVDKRMLFFLIYIIAIVFSLFSSKWVKVENDITTYLDESTETKQGLNLMDEEFVTYGTAEIMVANITFDDAKALEKKIKKQDGVSQVGFTKRNEKQKDFKKHYNQGGALYSVTFSYSEDDDRSLRSLDELKAYLSDYDIYVSTSLGDQKADIIASEMGKIYVVMGIVILVVLLFTCQSVGEIPVLVLTFLVSMILNNGTNFLFGTISFVSNSVSSILQLAMSIDYAVILCNHFKEERLQYDVRDSAVISLSKSIPEIAGSSMTTISGMFALVFMHFHIGKDMGTILIKAIILSLVAVFTLMPGLLVLFSDIMEKTEHKNLVPKITFVGELAYRLQKPVPILFVGLFFVVLVISQHCPYVYGESLLSTPILNETQIAKNMIESHFGKTNFVALLVPGHDYETEKAFIEKIENDKEVDYVQGLANTEIKDGYTLTDALNPREFSEMADIEYGACELLYQAYAADQEEYGRAVTGVATYRIPLMDMFRFVVNKVREGYVDIGHSTEEDLYDADEMISEARDQLEGKNYDRILVFLTLPEESPETYAYIDKLHELGVEFYGRDNPVLVAGNSTSDMDLKRDFDKDNIIVSVVSALFVLVILLFTFKSAGLPVLQILVIEGAIFLNFSFPVIFHDYVFFMSYLIVSSLQMGANIDYAIVISSRYIEDRQTRDKKESIIEALNFAFPTIVTSGTILMVAGFAIGMMSSDPSIVGIGQALGRGTLISLILVLLVLPEILLLGDRLIAATTFEVYRPVRSVEVKGDMLIDGAIKGTVNGTVIGRFKGVVRGDAKVSVLSGRLNTVSEGIADEFARLYQDSQTQEDAGDPGEEGSKQPDSEGGSSGIKDRKKDVETGGDMDA